MSDFLRSLTRFKPLNHLRPLAKATIDEMLDCTRLRQYLPVPVRGTYDPRYEVREVTLQDVAEEFAAREELAKRWKAEADAAREFLSKFTGMPITEKERDAFRAWYEVSRENHDYERGAAMDKVPLFPGRKTLA